MRPRRLSTAGEAGRLADLRRTTRGDDGDPGAAPSRTYKRWDSPRFVLERVGGGTRLAFRPQRKTDRRFELVRLLGDRSLTACSGRCAEAPFPAMRTSSHRQSVARLCCGAAKPPRRRGRRHGGRPLQGRADAGRKTFQRLAADDPAPSRRTMTASTGKTPPTPPAAEARREGGASPPIRTDTTGTYHRNPKRPGQSCPGSSGIMPFGACGVTPFNEAPCR